MCLDGCDTDIALHGLCPHGVVSQVVWGSVAAWTDLHGVRLTDDEVLAATTSLDAGGEKNHEVLCEVIQALPALSDLRCPDKVWSTVSADVANNLQGLECSNDTDSLGALEIGASKLRRVAYVHLTDRALLRELVSRVECFTGFAWAHADKFDSWLFPVPRSLERLRLGYVDPPDVIELLRNAPPALVDISLQGWNGGMSRQTRGAMFADGAVLPPHIEAFELQDDEGHARASPRLELWAFIEPAAARLRVLALSAPFASDELDRLLDGCPCLEDLRISVWEGDDPVPARQLLFSDKGVPMLRRLAIEVASEGKASWGVIRCVSGENGRSTITALSLGLPLSSRAVTGEQLRPFAPRLSELAVRELSTPGGYCPTFPLLTSLAVNKPTSDLRAVLARHGELMPHLRKVEVKSDEPLPFDRVTVHSSNLDGFHARGRFKFA